MRRFVFIFAAVCSLSAFITSADAGTVMLTDTITATYFAGDLDPDATIGTFDFFGDDGLSDLKEITDISIRFTMRDGDSDTGEFDHDDLVLVLDDENTGIALNGFGNGSTDTVSNSGTPDNASEILAALLSDGELVADVLDLDGSGGNWVKIKAYDATLTIRGVAVPLPAAAPAGLLLLGGFGLFRWRRRAKQRAREVSAG